jgi:hypothetical protein
LKEIPIEEPVIDEMPEDTGINIWIDKYNDVFSGFDTRPLVKRKLSNDFITEIGKMVREDPSPKVELNFNILDDQQDPEVETIIINHLRTHFANKKKAEQEAIKKTFRKGYLLTALGFVLILGLAYISSIAKGAFFLNSLPLLTEPLAWFTTWTGLDHIFKHYGSDANVDVNSKMLDAKISFMCLGQMMPDAEVETAAAPQPKKVIPAGNNLRIS